MWDGLASSLGNMGLSDLSDTFEQFTANLTNLDSLQEQETSAASETDKQVSSLKAVTPPEKIVAVPPQASRCKVRTGPSQSASQKFPDKSKSMVDEQGAKIGCRSNNKLVQLKQETLDSQRGSATKADQFREMESDIHMLNNQLLSATEKLQIDVKRCTALVTPLDGNCDEVTTYRDKLPCGEQFLQKKLHDSELRNESTEIELKKVSDENEFLCADNKNVQSKETDELKLEILKKDKDIDVLRQELIELGDTLRVKDADTRELLRLQTQNKCLLAEKEQLLRQDMQPYLIELQSLLNQKEQELSKYVDTSSAEVEVLKQSIEQQNHDRAKINEIIEQMAIENKNIVSSKENDARIIKELTDTCKTLTSDVESLNNQLDKVKQVQENKDKEYQCLDVKYKTLTEKTKDLMQRYADAKSKSAQADHITEAKSCELSKLCQAKDSEIMSLKLKIENVERSFSDMKIKASDLADRYSDTQREMTKAFQDAQSATLELLVVKKQLQNLQAKYDASKVEIDALKSSLFTQISTNAASKEKYEETINKIKYEAAKVQHASEQKVIGLQLEIDEMLLSVRDQSANSDILGEYKKKARGALAKANNTITEMSRQELKLKESIADAEQHIAELEERVATSLLLIESLRTELKFFKEDNPVQVLPSTIQLNTLTNSSGPPGRSPTSDCDIISNSGIGSSTSTSTREVVSIPTSRQWIRPKEQMMTSSATASGTTASWASLASVSSSSPFATEQNSDGPSAHTFAVTPVSAFEDVQSYNREPATFDYDKIVGSEGSKQIGAPPFVFVNQLHQQIERLKREIATRGIEIQVTQEQLQHEREYTKKLTTRIDELESCIERVNILNSGPDSAINMEYLKNCAYKFMVSTSPSERQRLAPVICTILKFTAIERENVDALLFKSGKTSGEIHAALSGIGSIASTLWGSWGHENWNQQSAEHRN